ncbi:hypothetical protein [Halorussus aquaticus]|uniref:Uncharacterized protein n=1 Tax=Halorussus aquaticus TaxID=2953748 RepID=A0ABD5Q2V8_9EURY|nr:hypothetical protein [Halorussus aquaticus]
MGAAAHAQELLPTGLDPRDPDKLDTRVLAGTSSSPRLSRRRRQATLTGEKKKLTEVRRDRRGESALVNVNARKGMHGEGGREDAAEHPGQSRLSTFEDYDLDLWSVTVPWFRDSAVTVPAGNVY